MAFFPASSYGEQPDRCRHSGENSEQYIAAQNSRIAAHEKRIGIKSQQRKIGDRPGPDYLSSVEVAIEIGVSNRTISTWTQFYGLPARANSGRRKMNWYRLADVRRWMTENDR